MVDRILAVLTKVFAVASALALAFGLTGVVDLSYASHRRRRVRAGRRGRDCGQHDALPRRRACRAGHHRPLPERVPQPTFK